MLQTSQEIAAALGERIRARRIASGLTQAMAAERAGVAYRTWRRMEAEGRASIDDLIRAALALRCEDGLTGLFPATIAATMDALLALKKTQTKPPARRRAPSGQRRLRIASDAP
jgi:transcriptional regulator with XRE-family HTH domain